MISRKAVTWFKKLFIQDSVEITIAKKMFRNNMRYFDFKLIKGEVVCEYCRNNCGECGIGGNLHDLQMDHDQLFNHT